MFKTKILIIIHVRNKRCVILQTGSEQDLDTLKRRGASQGSSGKKGVLEHYLPFLVKCTHKNENFSNEKGQPPATSLELPQQVHELQAIVLICLVHDISHRTGN